MASKNQLRPLKAAYDGVTCLECLRRKVICDGRAPALNANGRKSNATEGPLGVPKSALNAYGGRSYATEGPLGVPKAALNANGGRLDAAEGPLGVPKAALNADGRGSHATEGSLGVPEPALDANDRWSDATEWPLGVPKFDATEWPLGVPKPALNANSGRPYATEGPLGVPKGVACDGNSLACWGNENNWDLREAYWRNRMNLRRIEWSEAEDLLLLRLKDVENRPPKYIASNFGKKISAAAILERYSYLKADGWSEAENNILLRLVDDENLSLEATTERLCETGRRFTLGLVRKSYYQLKQDRLLLKYRDEGFSFKDIALKVSRETGQPLTVPVAKKSYLNLRWLPIEWDPTVDQDHDQNADISFGVTPQPLNSTVDDHDQSTDIPFEVTLQPLDPTVDQGHYQNTDTPFGVIPEPLDFRVTPQPLNSTVDDHDQNTDIPFGVTPEHLDTIDQGRYQNTDTPFGVIPEPLDPTVDRGHDQNTDISFGVALQVDDHDQSTNIPPQPLDPIVDRGHDPKTDIPFGVTIHHNPLQLLVEALENGYSFGVTPQPLDSDQNTGIPFGVTPQPSDSTVDGGHNQYTDIPFGVTIHHNGAQSPFRLLLEAALENGLDSTVDGGHDQITDGHNLFADVLEYSHIQHAETSIKQTGPNLSRRFRKCAPRHNRGLKFSEDDILELAKRWRLRPANRRNAGRVATLRKRKVESDDTQSGKRSKFQAKRGGMKCWGMWNGIMCLC
ncbi:MAG: hypothetical protein M1840_006353 [Geoglossum simile]|nr:MAG: hypothetical protein M1840_006353 [Geoglossum simile]